MKKTAFLYIVIAGICWGTSGIFVHYLAPYGFTSFHMTAVRGTVSFLCMAVYVLLKDRSLLKTRLLDLVLFLLIGATLFGTAASYYWAMQMTSVSTAVVLMYAAPVYVMIVSVLFFGERFSRLKLISVVLMLAGCALVSGIIGGMKFHPTGVLIGVLSGLIYASYSIFTKIAMKRGCKPVTTTFYSFFFMSLIALLASSPLQMLDFIPKNPPVVISLMIGLGIVTFVIPYFLYTLAIRNLSAGTASALSIIEPLAATIFSVVIFRETLTAFAAVGIVLILLAVILLGKAEGEKT